MPQNALNVSANRFRSARQDKDSEGEHRKPTPAASIGSSCVGRERRAASFRNGSKELGRRSSARQGDPTRAPLATGADGVTGGVIGGVIVDAEVEGVCGNELSAGSFALGDGGGVARYNMPREPKQGRRRLGAGSNGRVGHVVGRPSHGDGGTGRSPHALPPMMFSALAVCSSELTSSR